MGAWTQTSSQTCPCLSMPIATSPVQPPLTPAWMPAVISLWGSLAPCLPFFHHPISPSVARGSVSRYKLDADTFLLKTSQAPHLISNKIWTFQVSLKALCSQDRALHSNESSPTVSLCSCHSAPLFCAGKLLAPRPLHMHPDALSFQSFAQFCGSQSVVLGLAASVSLWTC